MKEAITTTKYFRCVKCNQVNKAKTSPNIILRNNLYTSLIVGSLIIFNQWILHYKRHYENPEDFYKITLKILCRLQIVACFYIILNYLIKAKQKRGFLYFEKFFYYLYSLMIISSVIDSIFNIQALSSGKDFNHINYHIMDTASILTVCQLFILEAPILHTYTLIYKIKKLLKEDEKHKDLYFV